MSVIRNRQVVRPTVQRLEEIWSASSFMTSMIPAATSVVYSQSVAAALNPNAAEPVCKDMFQVAHGSSTEVGLARLVIGQHRNQSRSGNSPKVESGVNKSLSLINTNHGDNITTNLVKAIPAQEKITITPPTPITSTTTQGGALPIQMHGGAGNLATSGDVSASAGSETIRPMTMAPTSPASNVFGVARADLARHGNSSDAVLPPPAPTVILSGGATGGGVSYTDMVGDGVQVIIKPGAGQTLTGATVTATNAISNIQFNTTSGSTVPLAADTPADLENNEGILLFNWNGTPGTNTVNVSVSYAGVAAPVKAAQISVTVQAPTFSSFTDTQQPFQFGLNQATQTFGLFQASFITPVRNNIKH